MKKNIAGPIIIFGCLAFFSVNAQAQLGDSCGITQCASNLFCCKTSKFGRFSCINDESKCDWSRSVNNEPKKDNAPDCGPSGCDCNLNGDRTIPPTTPFIMPTPTRQAPVRPPLCEGYMVPGRVAGTYVCQPATSANVFEAFWNFITHK